MRTYTHTHTHTHTLSPPALMFATYHFSLRVVTLTAASIRTVACALSVLAGCRLIRRPMPVAIDVRCVQTSLSAHGASCAPTMPVCIQYTAALPVAEHSRKRTIFYATSLRIRLPSLPLCAKSLAVASRTLQHTICTHMSVASTRNLDSPAPLLIVDAFLLIM